MSALPPKADIRQPEWHVRYVPIADIGAVRIAVMTPKPPGRRRLWQRWAAVTRYGNLPRSIARIHVISPASCKAEHPGLAAEQGERRDDGACADAGMSCQIRMGAHAAV